MSVNFKATKEQIVERLDRLADKNIQYDYNSICDEIIGLLSDCFGYGSHHGGITGFQASCIDLELIKLNRGWNHGFCLLNYKDLLYPQYRDHFKTAEQLLDDNNKSIGKSLVPLLIELINEDNFSNFFAHKNVRDYWEFLLKRYWEWD